MKFSRDFDQNSGILMNQELDDHRISVLDFKDFDQNSSGQP